MLKIFSSDDVINCKRWGGASHRLKRAFAEAATQKPKYLYRSGKRAASAQLRKQCSGTDIYLLPVAGSTLNVLPQAPCCDILCRDALGSTLAKPSTKALWGGRTAGELFVVAAIVATLCCGWTRANPSANATVSTPFKSVVAFQAMFDTKIQQAMSPEMSSETEILAVV